MVVEVIQKEKGEDKTKILKVTAPRQYQTMNTPEPEAKPLKIAGAHRYGRMLYKSLDNSVNCYLLSGYTGGQKEVVRIERKKREDCWGLSNTTIVNTKTPAKTLLHEYHKGGTLEEIFKYSPAKSKDIKQDLRNIAKESNIRWKLGAELEKRTSKKGALVSAVYDPGDVIDAVNNMLTVNFTYKLEWVGITLEKFLDEAMKQIIAEREGSWGE